MEGPFGACAKRSSEGVYLRRRAVNTRTYVYFYIHVGSSSSCKLDGSVPVSLALSRSVSLLFADLI